jgi:hypothetical protein
MTVMEVEIFRLSLGTTAFLKNFNFLIIFQLISRINLKIKKNTISYTYKWTTF